MTPRGGRSGAARSGDRAELGGEQVEGKRAVLELLRAQRRAVRAVHVAEGAERDEVVAEIVERAGARARIVSPARLQSLARSHAPQGVVATAAPLRPGTVDDLLVAGALLVALDGVTDPQNLGAVVRAAETAGATGLVLPKHRSARITPTVAKAAAGAIEHLPIALVSGIPSLLERAARAAVWTVGLDERGETSLHDLTLAAEPMCLVMGAEGRGLSPLTLRRCDVLVHIPVFGRIPSLNVAAAATLACHEIAWRRRNMAPGSPPG